MRFSLCGYRTFALSQVGERHARALESGEPARGALVFDYLGSL
jgi:hypothetical protein